MTAETLDEQEDKVIITIYSFNQPFFNVQTVFSLTPQYLLVEYLTNMSLASQLNVLTKLNITAALVTDLCQLAKSQGVVLRIIVEEGYIFVNEVRSPVL